MAVRVAINGFGRIGRLVLRCIIETGRKDLQVVAINDLGPPETNAHLLRYDSVHGRFPGEVKVQGDRMIVDGQDLKVTAIKDPSQLPHKELGVDIALECTGIFTSKERASAHLDGRRQARADFGARRRRRSDRRLWRQPSEADARPHRGFERVLHHELPRAGRQGAARHHRHRAWLHDDGAFLHQRPALARSDAQGSLPRPRGGPVHDPDVHRRGQGGRPGAAGAERQARRRRHPRADAQRLGDRFQGRRQAQHQRGAKSTRR